MTEFSSSRTKSSIEKEPLPNLEGKGEDLPTVTRHRLEMAIGDSLAGIRLHRGPAADRAAAPFGATGMSYGDDIVLSSRAYSAGAQGAEAVLAHEAAHVVQQRRGGAASTARTEHSANLAAVAHTAGDRAPAQQGAARGLSLSDCEPPEQVHFDAPSEYQFDESNVSFLETRQDLHRTRNDDLTAIVGASGYSMVGMSERQRYDTALAAEGIRQAEYERHRSDFVADFQGYAVSWAFQMLKDTHEVAQREQARYAAGTDVDTLWDLLARARSVAPAQAERERSAAMAMTG